MAAEATAASVDSASRAVSNPGADVERDLQRLLDLACEAGAARAAVIDATKVLMDRRCAEEAHGARCRCPAYNLMSPPFSPGAEDAIGWVRAFRHGLLVRADGPTTVDRAPFLQGSPGWACRLNEWRRRPAFAQTVVPVWKRLHEIMLKLEREGMRSGYYLSVGFVAGDCELCAICETAELCVLPYVARPAMEALGVDVARTAEAAGWEPSGWGIPPGRASLTGLFLLV